MYCEIINCVLEIADLPRSKIGIQNKLEYKCNSFTFSLQSEPIVIAPIVHSSQSLKS
jgi:hypothetical protein